MRIQRLCLFTAISIFSAPLSEQIDLISIAEAIDFFQAGSKQTFNLIKNVLTSDPTYIAKFHLESETKVSAFLPTDAAVVKMPISLLSDFDGLLNIISYHFIRNETVPLKMNSTSFFSTLKGSLVKVKSNETGSYVISGLESHSKILGNVTVGRVSLYFVEKVLSPPTNLIDTLLALEFTSLPSILTYLNLNSLTNAANNTIFVPTETSLQDFIQKYCTKSLTFNEGYISSLLKTHIIPKYIFTDTLKNSTNVTTVSDQILKLTYNETVIRIRGPADDEVNVIRGDILFLNGTIHVISGVILPSKDEIVCSK